LTGGHGFESLLGGDGVEGGALHGEQVDALSRDSQVRDQGDEVVRDGDRFPEALLQEASRKSQALSHGCTYPG